MFCFFLFNITTTTDIYTLSLHDALPILVESMYAFRANDVVGKIAPRPLLLLHPANDTVTPTEQSVDLFALAGQPTDLHLVAGVDHFMFSEGNTLVINLLRDWLALHFPSQ